MNIDKCMAQHKSLTNNANTDVDATVMVDGKTYFCLSYNGYTLGYEANTASNKGTFQYKCIAIKDAPRIFCFVTAKNPNNPKEEVECLGTYINNTIYYLYFVNGNEWYMSSSLDVSTSQSRLVHVDKTHGKLYLYGNPGWSESNGSRRYLYITANGELKDDNKQPSDSWTKPEISSYEVPVVEFVPVYSRTLKGKNNKLNSDADNGDNDVDSTHPFVGVVVKSKWKNAEATGTPNGILSEEDITKAIGTALDESANAKYKYSAADPKRGILYVDMKSNLKQVQSLKADDSAVNPWLAFNQSTADNCLYFFPKGYTSQWTTDGLNFVTDATSLGDIKLCDRQPFFNPMQFNVKDGCYATYTREITGGDENVEVNQGSLILPFAVTLTEGKKDNVAFYNLGTVSEAFEGGKQVYNVDAVPVYGKTEANVAYHTAIDAGYELYTISEQGATLVETPDTHKNTATDNGEDMENVSGSWTACGNYCGESSLNADNKYFYNSEYFWLSANQKCYNDILVGPFRAYFNLNSGSRSAKYRVVLQKYDESVSIDSPTAPAVVADGIYNIHGVRMQVDSADELPRGLYIINGKKIIKK